MAGICFAARREESKHAQKNQETKENTTEKHKRERA
jgi:hypothetical protein